MRKPTRQHWRHLLQQAAHRVRKARQQYARRASLQAQHPWSSIPQRRAYDYPS